jgi:hypothetical protein
MVGFCKFILPARVKHPDGKNEALIPQNSKRGPPHARAK